LTRADGLDGLYAIPERFGVCVAPNFTGVPSFPGHISDFARAADLGFGWYSDWTVKTYPERPNGIAFAQLLSTGIWPPSWSALRRAAAANPGSLWIIGNEPETRGQGQHEPLEYAQRYHQAYTFLKDVDPTCQIAIGGVVMPTPLRLEWLDRCLSAYRQTYGQPMPIDVWNIHMQILQEKRGDWGCGIPYGLDDVDQGRLYGIIDNCNVDAFRQLIIEFCQWLVAHDERDKPLIISEYGVLMPSSYLPQGDRSVSDFMLGTFDWMLTARDPLLGYAADDDRLVQRWMWFSLNFPFYDLTPGGFNGALCNWQQPDQLTPFGTLYAEYVRTARHERVVLGPSADTSTDGYRPTEALGTSGRLLVRADHQGGAAAAWLRFDLSSLPAGAIISRATLELPVVSRSNSQPLRLVVAPALAPWQDDLTASDLPADATYRGTPQQVVTLWPDDQSLVVPLTELALQWQANPRSNLGLVLDPQGAGNGGNVSYWFASSEWVESAASGPQLVLDYLVRAAP
jgi:hypothetical protein